MKLHLFKSKLAQKIFILFVTASLLPLLLGTWLSYSYVKRIIEQDISHHLHDTAKGYGLALYSRLKLSKDILNNNIDVLLNNRYDNVAQNNLPYYFTALSIYQNNSEENVLWGEIDPSVYDINTTNVSQLITIKKTENKHDIYISLPEGIYAKVNLKYLWDIENQDYDVEFCIINNKKIKLFCPNSLLANEIKLSTKESNGPSWKKGDGDTFSSFWPLFMDHEFNIDDWVIIAYQDSEIGLDRIYKHNKLFIPLILFSVLLVVLLSSFVIRRNLEVINKLIEGTRKIINKDFDNEINIETKDEFHELASSFNIMSGSLKKVAEEYQAFAIVDETILSYKSPAIVIEAIFNSLYTISKFETIIFINRKEKFKYLSKLYYQTNSKSKVQSNTTELLSLSRAYDNNEKLQLLVDNDEQATTLKKEFNIANTSIYKIPIFHQEEYFAIIYASIKKNNIDAFTEDKIKHFSSKIAVALQALNRKEELNYQANYDLLTNIPNRSNITSLYEKTIKAIQNANNKVFAFLFIDLDRFKEINDNYGHVVGDKLLQKFAIRIRKILHPEDIFARLGGDEFAIIRDAKDEAALIENIDSLCKEIVGATKNPFNINNNVLHIGTSIGVTIAPIHACTFENSLKYSDIAMYFAKKDGGNCYRIYKPEMSESLHKQALLERDLRQAVKERDIDIHYQAKVDANTLKLKGFEALFRWNHSTYGAISPIEAITMAEDIGLIEDLGKLVFGISLQQLQDWLAEGYQIETMAINVSPIQLVKAGFVEFVKTSLKQFPLVQTQMIELEITESVMLEQTNKALDVLQELRNLGINIAIDDFGTGYSSLSYLLDIPANILKIDRAFVIKIEQDDNASLLLSSLINLGKSMDYSIVAEGVETEQQVTFLKQCQVDQFQGYLFSKPLPASSAEFRFFKQPLSP